MDDKKGDFKAARTAFNKLKVDPSSAVFAEEILDKKLLLKLKIRSMQRKRNFLNL